jgi:glycosyltransferase involved in cell wall biosynthesis
MPSVSIITPTIGRESLETMLQGLAPQLSKGDEVLVIGDGPQAKAAEIVGRIGSPYVRYWEHGPIWNYGNPQRNLAIAEAKGDYIMFIDDDDRPAQGGVGIVKAAIDQFHGRPLMFKMPYMKHLIWKTREVRCGNVSGQMFMAPNVKGRLGQWSGLYAGDFDFIKSTLLLYPERDKAVVWREEIVTIPGVAGRGVIGKEIK